MPEVGLEPTCPCGREILSLVRIPISPLRLGEDDRCWGEGESTGRNIFASLLREGICELVYLTLKVRRAAAQLREITACLKSPAGVNMSCLFGVTAMRWGVAGFALSLLKVSPEGSP